MNTILNKLTLKSNKPLCNVGDPKNVFTNVAVWFIACLGFVILYSIFTIYNIYNNSVNTYADYTISMTTSGAHSIDVMPGAGGETGTSISEDAITVTTTCPSGYNLTLSTSVNDNNLYLGGDRSNNATGTYFTPADGTTALSSDTNINTWGYYYESSNSNNTAPTKTSIFNPVPVLGSATTIKTSTSTSDSFSVYYGVAVSSSMAPGTYKMIPDTNNAGHDGAIVYQLTMSQSCLPYTVVFNPTSTAGGTTVTGTSTMSDQIIPAGVATALATNTFTAPTGYEFDSWNTAQDGTGTSYTDGQSVTDLTTGGTSITLYAQWKKASINLYNTIATAWENEGSRVMTNDTDTSTGIQAAITATNSGVFKYNPTAFGASSDASNDYDIYFYRGILDSNLDGTDSTYGSAGDGVTHPNYVKLGITCWRIVRTTGSGGVKMIYNGMYGNTTAGSCANPTTAAQIRSTSATTADSTATFTSAFAGTSAAQYRSIVGVGYTRNNTYASTSATTATAYSTLFGTNSSYSGNSTNSTIKGYIETWFTNNLNSYASILESSAGYCNDRSIRSSSSSTSLIADSTTIVPYGTSSMTAYYFGPYVRNTTTSDKPTLNCPRNVVDLYTTSSASDGNKQLSKPVALLTADEVSFAGSGRTTATQGSAYHYNSYLRSGSIFWLLSPGVRYSNGYAYGFILFSSGILSDYIVYSSNGMRPAISLTSGTTATSGTGTATDPWVVTAP